MSRNPPLHALFLCNSDRVALGGTITSLKLLDASKCPMLLRAPVSLVPSSKYCQSQLLHHSHIMSSTSYDPARDWFYRPDPCFLPRYTPAHSSGGIVTSGERALLPEFRVVVGFVVLRSPDHRGFVPKTVLCLEGNINPLPTLSCFIRTI